MRKIPITTRQKGRKNNAFYVKLKWFTWKYSTSHILLINKEKSQHQHHDNDGHDN